MKNFDVVFDALGVAPVFARMACDEGSGNYTGVPGEGNFVMRADLESIHYSVADVTDPDNESSIIEMSAIIISDVLSDSPSNDPRNWKIDQIGYNFSHRVPAAAFPIRGRRYRVTYEVRTTGGNVRHLNLVGTAI